MEENRQCYVTNSSCSDDNLLASATMFVNQLTQKLHEHIKHLQSLMHKMTMQQKSNIAHQMSSRSGVPSLTKRGRCSSASTPSNSKSVRYNRTHDILKQSGLLDIAKQTSDLHKQTAVLDNEILRLKEMVSQYMNALIYNSKQMSDNGLNNKLSYNPNAAMSVQSSAVFHETAVNNQQIPQMQQ